MSLKAMVFIDGAWLYRNRTSIFAKLGAENGCEIDYAKLPRVFCEDVANHLDEDVDLVRTNYFGTIPSARSSFSTSKQYKAIRVPALVAMPLLLYEVLPMTI